MSSNWPFSRCCCPCSACWRSAPPNVGRGEPAPWGTTDATCPHVAIRLPSDAERRSAPSCARSGLAGAPDLALNALGDLDDRLERLHNLLSLPAERGDAGGRADRLA